MTSLIEQRNPTQDRSVATQERLITAAIQAFSRGGYDASSTRQIEAAAGVKRGLISYHFGTKEALWKAAAAWLFARAAEASRTAEETATDIDGLAKLRYYIRSLVRFSAAYPEVNRLMIREGMDDDWRLEWLVEHAARPWYERVKRVFDAATDLGVAPKMDYPHFYYIVVGAAGLMFSMAPEARRLANLDPQDDAVIDAHADALANLLIRGDTS